MTCSEFRNAYDILVDEGRAGMGTGEMLLHLQSCMACASYGASIASLDERLKTVEFPAPDAAFESRLLAMAQRQDVEASRPSLLRGLAPAVAVILPCAVLWGATVALPFEMQVLIHALLSAAGIAVAATAILKPRMLST